MEWFSAEYAAIQFEEEKFKRNLTTFKTQVYITIAGGTTYLGRELDYLDHKDATVKELSLTERIKYYFDETNMLKKTSSFGIHNINEAKSQ